MAKTGFRPIFRIGDVVPFSIHCQDEDGPINLIGGAIEWVYKITDLAGATLKAVSRPAAIIDAAHPLGAFVRYVTLPTDLEFAGFLYWEWKLTDSGGGISHGPPSRRSAEITQPIA